MNTVKVYATKIYKSDTSQRYDYIRSYLSKERLYKIDKLYQLDDKLRTLKSEWLVRTIISQLTNLPFNKLVFSVTSNGKPYISNVDSFHYNISHSGQWIVLAIGCDEVGIDIEEIKPIDFSIIKHCFSNKEITNFYNTSKESQLSYFYELWTLKESLVKTIGKGILMPLKSFSIEISNDNIVFQDTTFFFKQYNIDPKYKLSVCSKLKTFTENLVIV